MLALKSMKKLFFSLLLLSSCASEYKGPKPDFSLRGELAKKEIENFSLNESYWHQSRLALCMGPANRYYSEESIESLIKETSPSAIAKLEGSRRLASWWWLPYSAAVAILLVDINNQNFDSASQSAFYTLLGTSVVISIVELNMRAEAAEIYNRDLKNRFTPMLSFRYSLP